MARKSTSTARFALALLFSASAGSLAMATPATAQEMSAFQNFADSGYSYCDAKMIGSLYGQGAYDGKLIIGQKIDNGLRDNIPLILRESRQQGNTCDWSDVPHSYSDAEQLGEYWGVNPYQAKMKAAMFYTNGQGGIVKSALRQPVRTSEDQQSLEAFGRSGFTYCDAKLIGAMWETDVVGGKVVIGNKIRWGVIEYMPGFLQSSREAGNSCGWGDTSYTYADAERLSGMWSQGIGETKSTIAKLVTMGRSDVVDGSLGR